MMPAHAGDLRARRGPWQAGLQQGAAKTTGLAGAAVRGGPLAAALSFHLGSHADPVGEASASKLRMGARDDPLEREAERMADHVSDPGPSGVPQDPLTGGMADTLRACGTSEGPCPCHDRDDQPAATVQLQRSRGSATDSGQRAPDVVARALAEPGQPLDHATRSRFEALLGADFGDVRLHNSATAAASAQAIGARAYTVGNKLVFGPGQYAPTGPGGGRLLAHELAHVVQGRVGGRTTVRRQAGQAAVDFQVPANVCTPAQTRELVPAVTTAQRWLQAADARLSAYATGSPQSETSKATGLSMLRHMANSDAATVRYVQNIIRRVADLLRTDPSAPSPLTVQCHGPADRTCGSSAAYVSNANLLVFCPSFFGSDVVWAVSAVIHEIAHSLIHGGPLRITDRAYQRDRLYGQLSPGEALTNAESYALLVRELATGPVSGMPPRDTYEDCPADWRAALSTAIARAQRWNRDAQVAVLDQKPVFLASWNALATAFLGGQSPAQVAAAATVYNEAEVKFKDRVDFECEASGGGRCDTSSTYWYALGDFHICPSWRNRASDDDRAEELLAGLYGYYRIVDDHRRRQNLASLARRLHYQFWAPPSAADVSGALANASAQPQPPAAPAPGPVPAL
jgi:hypothetical protein